MDTNEKLARLSDHLDEGRVKVLIVGLGSVGNYLLTYLLELADPQIEIIVAGRNEAKIESDVNIALVSALIRRKARSQVRIIGGVDLEEPDTVARCLEEVRPDIVVNTSRVYAGLKYGSISWGNVRAYGIWTPLSIRYIRNIMQAYEQADCKGLVINTSYSDATIPWLKSAGIAYPDFGSGNLNHIIPRIKLAAASIMGVEDYWNVDVDLATAHFHDVVISKEGHAEGVSQLLRVRYGQEILDIPQEDLLIRCAIAMPTDQKRNMMNASSNFDIICSLLKALRGRRSERFFSPGAFGEIGGYPVVVDGAGEHPSACVDESCFDIEEMRKKNRESIALDGVEDIDCGSLVYTDALIDKARAAFGATLPKRVAFDEIDDVASFIIESVIEPALSRH